MEENDYYIDFAKQWLDISIEAVKSHRRKDGGKGFIRTSDQRTPTPPKDIFSTATFQAYSALFNVVENYSDAMNDLIFSKVSIEKYLEFSENRFFRSPILFEPILSILHYWQLKAKKFKWNVTFKDLKKYILAEDEKRREEYFYPETGRSPWLLLTLLTCQNYIDTIYPGERIVKEKDQLNILIDSHINYQMARKESYFDPISLMIAICCKIKIDDTFKKSPFFISCLDAVVKQQYNDGSWPTGATIAFSESGDVIQQASIQIASYLADSIIDYKFLVDCDESTESVLNILIPSFGKLAQYMVSTYVVKTEVDAVNGWSSDRLKIKNYTETWITAYACRFFHKYYLAEKAYARIKALKYFGVHNSVYNPQDNEKQAKDWEKIIDPDSVLKPKEEIKRIIKPIIDKRNKGELLITPEKDNLSFIICGPPGSGKTYIVNNLAKTIGWPLVELSPSQFIKDGLEFIESTSKKIFEEISNLYHAVVFFDECDELFRERKENGTNNRTILNFLTASMLPKLQKLHDKGNIIFIIGTNYLQNIDDAIRRKGRFDFLLVYDRPDYESRKKYYFDIDKQDEIKADDFAKRTEMCLAKNLEKYLNGGFASEDDDYITWCKNVAKKEIEATRYTKEQKEKKMTQWDNLVKKHGNHESDELNNCDFCTEIHNQGNNIFNDIYDKLNVKTRIVGETDRFVVLPTIGQLFKHSLLILPKQHIESMSQLDEAGLEEFVDLVKKVKEKLSIYGKVVAFEHGAHKNTGGSCGIYHAHIHIIPLPTDLNLSDFFYTDSQVKKYSNLKECYCDLKESSQYLIAINTDDTLYATDTSNDIHQYPSQFFRKKLVEHYNLNMPWDWREYQTAEQSLLQSIDFGIHVLI